MIGIPEHIWQSGAASGLGPTRWLVLVALMSRRPRVGVGDEGELCETREVSVAELSRMTGMEREKVWVILEDLRKKGVVVYWLPDSDEEDGLFRIWGIAEFVPDLKGLRGRFKGFLKWIDFEKAPEDRRQMVVDRWLALTGGAMGGNPARMLMELEQVAANFREDTILAAFERMSGWKWGRLSADALYRVCLEVEGQWKKRGKRKSKV